MAGFIQNGGPFVYALFEGRRGDATHTVLALGAVVVMLAFASMVVAKDSPGNNGTVKVHDGGSEAEPVTQNDPHVACSFHLHFLFGDAMQSGTWAIQSWPPTGDGAMVAGDRYDTAGDGEARVPEAGAMSLTSGHYRLFWDGDDGKNDKHKTFWVDCPDGGGSPGG